jgi:hypothetical protein
MHPSHIHSLTVVVHLFVGLLYMYYVCMYDVRIAIRKSQTAQMRASSSSSLYFTRISLSFRLVAFFTVTLLVDCASESDGVSQSLIPMCHDSWAS